jgi:phosphatidyl-myo-inositol dimannoside synthase
VRILILTHNFPPQDGGISTHCYEMARHWARQEEVWVLAPHTSDEDANDFPFAGKLVRMPPAHNKLSRLLVSVESTLRLARKIRPDLIYGTHWRNCGIPLRVTGAATRVPFCLAVHGSEVFYLLERGRKVLSFLFRWVASGCRGFVALGQYQKQILGKLGISAAKIYTSPEGIDLGRLAKVDAEARRRIRARYHLNGKRMIMTVGRLVERKGHDAILRALPRVLKEIHDAVYLIVGKGPMEGRLRVLAREMGVEDRVVFCGFVPDGDLMAHYQACDVFAMPNREVGGDTEGFGIVFVEAGACGKPVIGGRSGGVVEVIEDGVTGFLVDPLSTQEVARALTSLLQDRDLAVRMGQAGRARVKQHYSYQRVAENIAAFLQKATGHPQS